MKTAREIAEWYAPSAADGLERDILRHMEHHMERAARLERDECAELADQMGHGAATGIEIRDAIRERSNSDH